VGISAEKFEQVREGVLSKVSVGYSILDYRIEGENLLVTKWEPYEISMVSVPADDFVGVGRSLEEEQEPEPEQAETENKDEQPAEQEERNEETENEPIENTASTSTATKSDPEIDTEAETINNSESNGDGEQPEPEEQNDDSAVQEEQAEEDQKRIAEINAISRAFNIHSEITNQAIESGLTIEAFRQQIKNKPIIKDDKQMEFSLNNLIRSIMDGDKSLPSGKNGAVVANADFAQAVRAGVTTTTAKDVIHTDVLYGSFVDILRAESVLKNFPVQMFTGLTSEIAVPKLAGDFTAGFGFISENGISPEVDANFESVVLKPKTFTGSVPLSRSVVKSCPQVEQIVSQAIVAGSAERLEALILKGIVDAVVAAGKVETVDSYTYAGIVEAQGVLGDAGVSFGSISAVMSPQTKATLRSTLRGQNTSGVYLFDEGDLCGVPAYDSKVLAGQDFIILGDFSKLAIAQWGDSLELDMDDTTNRNRGSVIARVWADLDFAVLVPEAFRIIKLA